MVVAVATLVGTPTGGALLKTVDDKHFTGLILFSGILTAAGTVILAAAGIAGSPRLRRMFTRSSGDPEAKVEASPGSAETEKSPSATNSAEA